MYKNIFSILVSGVIIIGSLITPRIYFTLTEDTLLETKYERQMVPINIAPEAEEIYMVRAVRDTYYLNSKSMTADDLEIEPEWVALGEKIETLSTMSFKTQIFTAKKAFDGEQMIALNDGMLLNLQIMTWSYDKQECCISVHQESKMDKFIFIALSNDERNKKSFYQYEHNQDHIASIFCEYLGLDVLDDWMFTAQGLVSQKASLKIICHESADMFLLYAAPLESQWEKTGLSQMEVQRIELLENAEY